MSLLSLLYRALDAKFGIVVSCSDPDRARAKFYAERRQSGDPALEGLVIASSRSNPESELLLLKKVPTRAEEN